MFKKDEILNSIHGTSYYIAPEVLGKYYNEKCDVWSIGVMLYILLSGRPPFDGDDDNEITEQVKIGNISYKDEIWKEISGEGIDLLKRMLNTNFKKRVSARDCLSHPWFKNAPNKAIDRGLMKEALNNLRTFQAEGKL